MAVATVFTDNMLTLTGNSGGGVQSLPATTVFGARQRAQWGRITLASQPSGTMFGVARIPLYAAIKSILALTDTSLGSTTIAFGDTNTTNRYVAATTFTSTAALTRLGPVIGQTGVPLTTGYDCVTGNNVSPFMPQTPGQGGGVYADIIMLTAAATMPASGNLVLCVEYQID